MGRGDDAPQRVDEGVQDGVKRISCCPKRISNTEEEEYQLIWNKHCIGIKKQQHKNILVQWKQLHVYHLS
jgi:hypothetical protein